MDYIEYTAHGADTLVHGVRHFCLADILDCGQCFRWEAAEQGGYRGVVNGVACRVTQQGATLCFHNTSPAQFEALWCDYFDFGRDYGALKTLLCTDPAMAQAVAFTPGMRVLRQPPWETLCSFILSANNNIARIRGIVARLCSCFGEPVAGGEGLHAFPTPERMAALSEQDLAPLRSGYRAAYLLDAARLVAGGELALEPLYTAPLEQARRELRRVKGVGPKVAECVLLYGFSRAECLPEDVWIKRALAALYPQGLPAALAPVAGLGQQYLFHYVRHCPEALAEGQPAP